MRKKLYDVLKVIQTWIDRITTGVASVLIGVMFLVIIANVILRGIPAVGGFRWYMEFSQYANVWAMLIAAAAAVGFDCTFELTKADGTVTSITGSELTGMAVDAGSGVVERGKDLVTPDSSGKSDPEETTVAEDAEADLGRTAEAMEQDLKEEAEAPKDEAKDS